MNERDKIRQEWEKKRQERIESEDEAIELISVPQCNNCIHTKNKKDCQMIGKIDWAILLNERICPYKTTPE